MTDQLDLSFPPASDATLFSLIEAREEIVKALFKSFPPRPTPEVCIQTFEGFAEELELRSHRSKHNKLQSAKYTQAAERIRVHGLPSFPQDEVKLEVENYASPATIEEDGKHAFADLGLEITFTHILLGPDPLQWSFRDTSSTLAIFAPPQEYIESVSFTHILRKLYAIQRLGGTGVLFYLPSSQPQDQHAVRAKLLQALNVGTLTRHQIKGWNVEGLDFFKEER